MTRYFHQPEAMPVQEFEQSHHLHHGSGQNDMWLLNVADHCANDLGIAALLVCHLARVNHLQ